MTVRYFGREGFDNSLSSASSPVSEGSPAIEEVFRGEFDENELFVSENVWRPDLNKWVDTRAVSELWFMGEGNLIKITEEQAMAFIEANRVRDENGEVAEGICLNGLEDQLLALEHEEAWVLDFDFGQWQDQQWNDDVIAYCQVLRLDDSNWAIEFSSDEFNNPVLTEQQREAILEAGFDEPDDDESPNYSLSMADPTAREVVGLIERVLNKGGFAE